MSSPQDAHSSDAVAVTILNVLVLKGEGRKKAREYIKVISKGSGNHHSDRRGGRDLTIEITTTQNKACYPRKLAAIPHQSPLYWLAVKELYLSYQFKLPCSGYIVKHTVSALW